MKQAFRLRLQIQGQTGGRNVGRHRVGALGLKQRAKGAGTGKAVSGGGFSVGGTAPCQSENPVSYTHLGAYGVTYPTVRLRLDRLIQKIRLTEEQAADPYVALIKRCLLYTSRCV